MKIGQKILFLIFLTTFILPTPALSQYSIIGANTGEIRLIPLNPKPNENTSAIFESYITDLSRAQIKWFLNGKLIKEGGGDVNFDFKNGPVGQKTEVQVIALTEEGWPLEDKISIYSAEVSLIYEAESSVPPFYKGKAKLPYEGIARVIAVPNFKTENGEIIPVNNLIFKWYRKNKLEISGTGKNIFTFKSTVPMSRNEIKVEVGTVDRKYFAQSYIEFLQFKSVLNLYENHPEYGILYNKSLNTNINLNKPEINLIAEPFFFNKVDLPFLSYKWILGNQELPDNRNSITLSGETDRSGSSSVSVESRNPANFYQFANQFSKIKVN